MSKQNKPRKQHYVPQYYLRNFHSKKKFKGYKNNGEPKYEYWIYFYDKTTKITKEVEVECVGQKKYFYDIPESLLLHILVINPKIIEKIIEKAYLEKDFWLNYDKRASILLKEILQKLEKKHSCNKGVDEIDNIIDYQDKEKIIILMVMQLIRTPKFRDKITDISGAIAQRKELWTTGEKQLDYLIEKILKAILDAPQYLHAKNYICNLERIEEIYCSLKERPFFIGINTSNKPLITSDSPVVFANEEEGFNEIQLSGEGLEISFPISSKFIAITIDNNDNYPYLMGNNIKGISLGLEEITKFNKLQLLQSVSQVYSNENFDWLHDSV